MFNRPLRIFTIQFNGVYMRYVVTISTFRQEVSLTRLDLDYKILLFH